MNEEVFDKELKEFLPSDLIGDLMIEEDKEGNCDEDKGKGKGKGKEKAEDDRGDNKIRNNEGELLLEKKEGSEDSQHSEEEIDNIGFQPRRQEEDLIGNNNNNDDDDGDDANQRFDYHKNYSQPIQFKSNLNMNMNVNKKVRFFSDASSFQNNFLNHNIALALLNSNSNPIPFMNNQQYMQAMFNNNSNNQIATSMQYNKAQRQCINGNNYPYRNQHNIYQGMGLSMMNIPAERKATDYALYTGIPFNNTAMPPEAMMSNMNYHNDYMRKNTGGSGFYWGEGAGMNPSNNNPIRPKGSFSSSDTYYKSNKSLLYNEKPSIITPKSSGKHSDFNLDQYGIKDFKTYLNDLSITIHEHIYTQKGSKEIQKRLNKSPVECRTILIESLKENMSKIMIHQHGNYFCQDFFRTCTPKQILLILKYIHKDFIDISMNSSGTHSLQSLIYMITTNEEQHAIISCIRHHKAELTMAYDDNATHVLLSIINMVQEAKRKESTSILINDIYSLSFHQKGICITKRLIETTISPTNKQAILEQLTMNCIEIAQDVYGNFGIQKCFETWSYKDYSEMIDTFIMNISLLSKQKHSSCVVEKLIELVKEEKRERLMKELFKESNVLMILLDQFGKFVLPKAVQYMTIKQKEEIKAELNNLLMVSHKGKNKLKGLIDSFDK